MLLYFNDCSYMLTKIYMIYALRKSKQDKYFITSISFLVLQNQDR